MIFLTYSLIKYPFNTEKLKYKSIMSYQIGDTIPSITLQDTEANQVTIKQGLINILYYYFSHSHFQACVSRNFAQ